MGACGGGDGTGGSVSPPPPPSSPPPPPFGATFAEIQANVFTPTCAVSGCHSGAGAPQGLRLDAGVSYSLLFDVESTQNPAFKRVDPGNPDDSWLIRKLEGTANVGARMPLGGASLSQATIDVIRQWISDGALNNGPIASDPVRVASMTPVPSSDTAPPSEVVVAFDREVDVSTVNALTFLFDRAGGDTTFGDGNEEAFDGAGRVSVDSSASIATFDLSGLTLPDDTYRVRLLGDGGSVILDIDANALDGEFSGSFPAGDGSQGGDFEATFEVTNPVSSATLDAIQASVFTPTCATAGCHSAASQAGGLILEAGQAYDSLVTNGGSNNPACAPLRVDPGNPDNSRLVQRIQGNVTPQMPRGGPELSQTLIDDIREWISNGANP
jgi:hypothetical protein